MPLPHSLVGVQREALDAIESALDGGAVEAEAFGQFAERGLGFLHARGGCGVRARETPYVGDRLPTDAIGAANAGLTGVWLNRDARPTVAELDEAAAAGVSVIDSLVGLPALLRAVHTS